MNLKKSGETDEKEDLMESPQAFEKDSRFSNSSRHVSSRAWPFFPTDYDLPEETDRREYLNPTSPLPSRE